MEYQKQNLNRINKDGDTATRESYGTNVHAKSYSSSENTLNAQFTQSELKSSIDSMLRLLQ